MGTAGAATVFSVPLIIVACSVGCAVPSQSKSLKRIADGIPLWSQDDFNTYHFVHLRDSWGCLSNQATHELGNCLEKSICGGTLVHPEFVITAQHCVFHWEFALRSFKDIYNVSIRDVPGLSVQDLGFFNYVERDVRRIANKPQSKHAFYSNVALMAGSTHYFYMRQKRHALKTFPHPTYFNKEYFSLVEHDVAIIQACEPFEMTEEVKIAKVKPMNMLLTQWVSIVKRSAACLFVGFGWTDDHWTRIFHNVNKNYMISTEYLRSTWRQIQCPEKCRVAYNPDEAHVNHCIGCSEHIPPGIGSALFGDSGGPVVCDGWYVALILGGWYDPASNETENWIYPLHCISKSFTPEAFEYYRTVPVTKYVPLVLDGIPTND